MSREVKFLLCFPLVQSVHTLESKVFRRMMCLCEVVNEDTVIWDRGFNLLTTSCVVHLSEPNLSSVQSLSRVWLFATPWTAARQASLSITNYRNPPKPMCIESVMPSNHLLLCRPLLLLPSIFSSIRVFSDESALHIRWPKYWSFSFNISLSNEHQDWSPLGWTGWISLPIYSLLNEGSELHLLGSSQI